MPKPLHSVPDISRPDQELILIIQAMLVKAKAGELRSAAVIGYTTDGDIISAYALGSGDVSHLIHAGEDLKMQLLGYGGEDE